MHQLGPISTSLALDDASQASLAKSYILVTHAYLLPSNLRDFPGLVTGASKTDQNVHPEPHLPKLHKAGLESHDGFHSCFARARLPRSGLTPSILLGVGNAHCNCRAGSLSAEGSDSVKVSIRAASGM